MRDLAAATVLVIVIAVGALAPALWQPRFEGQALASTAVSPTASPMPPSWKGKDRGSGFVVCAKNDSWSRPTVAEENAHLAADPRHANVRADDSYSPAWSPFRMGATLYDGSTSRDEVIAFTGLWSDPRAGATTSACVSSEPQVWLLGYAPVTYWAEDRLISELRVVPAPGYQIVVMTGTIRPRLVVADNMKVAVIQMPATALAPTPTPPPKPPVIQTPPPYVPHYTPAPAMPETTKPVGFELPQECLASAPTHSEGTLSSSTSWVVSCPDISTAQLATLMKRALFTQGWIEGQQLSGGVHEFLKGDLEVDVRFQDGAGFPTDRVFLAEHYICCGVATPPPSPAPVDLMLPRGCGIYENGIGIRTGQDGQVIHWIANCPPMMNADELATAFEANVEAQGWVRTTWMPRRATYRHPTRDLELVLEFVDGHVWFAEAGSVIAALPRSAPASAAPTVPAPPSR